MSDVMFNAWDQFIAWLAAEYAAGRDVSLVNAHISDQHVRWFGTIAGVRLDPKLAPAMTLKMKPAEVPLREGWLLDAEHLSLPVRGDIQLKKAADARVGQVVSFAARFRRSDALFPPLSFIPDNAQQRVFVTFGLEDVEILGFSQ